MHLSTLVHLNDPPENVVLLRARNVARPNAILMYEAMLRKVETVRKHRNAYVHGGSGKNPFSSMARHADFHASSKTGFRVSRLSSSRPGLSRGTSSSMYTLGHNGDKEDRPGACLLPSQDFRAAEVLAERLMSAFSEWNSGDGGFARCAIQWRLNAVPLLFYDTRIESFGFLLLFVDFRPSYGAHDSHAPIQSALQHGVNSMR